MHKSCTLYKTTEFIGKKWTLLILLELHKGKSKYKRYSELKRSLKDITPKILSSRLKELEKMGLIKKSVQQKNTPRKSEYSLTKSGTEFIKPVKEIKAWALKWNFKNKTCSSQDCSECTF